jgi:caa(3)-type oxidase subunit IV
MRDGNAPAPRISAVMKGPGLTLLCLLAILAVNVAAAFVDFGGVQLAFNIFLAAASVVIIAFFFMRLKSEPALNRLAASAGFHWLILFFMLTFGDYFTRVALPF